MMNGGRELGMRVGGRGPDNPNTLKYQVEQYGMTFF